MTDKIQNMMLVALCVLLVTSNTFAKLKKDKAKDNNIIIGKTKVRIIHYSSFAT